MADGTLVARAETFARHAHAGQFRKGDSNVPYFQHLASVERRLRTHGYDDPVVLAAALLHDVFEDQPAHAAALRSEFPDEVVRVVDLLTEQKVDSEGRRRSKPDRVHAYVTRLGGTGIDVARALAVSCADKVDNLSSLLDAERSGFPLLVQLNTRPGEYAPHLAMLRDRYLPVVKPSLLADFDSRVSSLLAYVAESLPSRALAMSVHAHLGFVDGLGTPYALHALGMASRAETQELRIAAALHDLPLADEQAFARLRGEGVDDATVEALRLLRAAERDSSEQALEAVLGNSIARGVLALEHPGETDPTAQLQRARALHATRRPLLDR